MMKVILNKILPPYLLGKHAVIGTVIFTVLFAIIFLNLYIPFSDTAWFALGDSVNFINTLAFASSSIFLLILSRVGMYMCNKRIPVTYFAYIIWCVMEIALVCFLYTEISMTADMPLSMDRWGVFKHAFPHCCIAIGIPYILSAAYLTIQDREKVIKMIKFLCLKSK